LSIRGLVLKSEPPMKVTILGCGTSTGVPVIGCKCNVCRSRDPKNRRTRTSALVSVGGKNLLIDTPPDFHQQAIANNLDNVDAVLYTHDHADHIFGMDDLRGFNFSQQGSIPIYASEKTMARIRLLFDYIWNPEAPVGGGKPMLDAHVINGEFDACGIRVRPIDIFHGARTINGFRINDFVYLTDCSGIPDQSRELLKDSRLLVLGALRFRPHPTHFSLSGALEEIARIRPGNAVLTHLSHSFDYQELNNSLPKGVELAYDGMVKEF
jgi:phosphoribosyl 1,2-cyclic phosphate phosphodiesterase